jgi:hypothetical protein
MRQIPLGTKGSLSLLVQPEHLAGRFKDAIPPPVFAPAMIMVVENAAPNAIRAYLDPGESAVGAAVNVRHLAATPVGCLVSGEAESLNQKPTSANRRLPLTAFETHNGRSTFVARTPLRAPLPTLPVGVCIAPAGLQVDLRRSQFERTGRALRSAQAD